MRCERVRAAARGRMPMSISLTRVHARYARAQRASLVDLTLAFAPGEQVAVIGPSGAGKTTLLATLACAIRPTEGIVSILGANPWQLSGAKLHKLRAQLFLAPQAPPLPPRQRVVNAVLAGRLPQWSTWQALASLVYPSDIPAARDALARFHLEDKLFLRCDRLSGGERQRVALARLMTSSARLMLLDEPVSALDPALARDALGVLQAEATARNATLIVSLHAVDLAMGLFDRIVGLKDGQVQFDLPRAKVTDAILADLYGAELASSFQSGALEQSVAQPKLARCM